MTLITMLPFIMAIQACTWISV